jgi:glucose/arabinose dehydrogenase
MRALLGACLIAYLAIAALGAAGAAAEPTLPGGFHDELVFDELDEPSAVRFASDGRVFVAEKTGKIEVYDSLSDPTPTLFADLRTEVYDTGDRGLLGLALDPNFPTKPYVYALYTYDHILGDAAKPPRWGTPDHTGDACSEPNPEACLVSGRLVRLEAESGGDHATVDGEGNPVQKMLAEGWCQQFSSHSIGDLQFGPEGDLYASGGEGASFDNPDYGQLGTPANPCGDPPKEGGSFRSQDALTPADPTGLSGAVIRIDPETGEGLPDNPMYATSGSDKNRKKIVGFGFRNPFRFILDPATAELYVDNVGSSEYEEIDRLPSIPQTAYNSGWPCYEGLGREFQFKTLELPICETLYANPSATNLPFFVYSHHQQVAPGDECPNFNGSAISGLSFYQGSGDYPSEYDGALFFADAVRRCIYVMKKGSDGRPDPSTVAPFLSDGDLYAGVDLEEGPEGDLYYASLFGEEGYADPGGIHRISYDQHAPTARLSADVTYGEVPLEVHLDASKSEDPEGEPLEYEWDLNDDGIFGTAGSTITTTLSAPVNTRLAVRVKDSEGKTSVARVTVYAGDEPPLPEIEEPESSLTWRVGQTIEFRGNGDNFKHEYLNNSNLKWSTRIFHCPDPAHPTACHAHPLQSFPGVREGSFLAPEHDLPSRIEISLTATDERGLAATETVDIYPRTVNIQVESSPPGLPLTAGSISQPAPFSDTAIEGAQVSLSAPPSVEMGGKTYTWTGWSDGGAASHTITAESSGTYTATYSTPAGPPPPPAVAPRATLGKHPSKKTKKTAATFKFSSNEAGSSFKCKLDKKSYKQCRSPVTYKHLKAGSHNFAVIAINSGGQSKPAKFSWKVLPK